MSVVVLRAATGARAMVQRTASRFLSEIPPNIEQATGMEKKELMGSKDVFWSREPIVGPRGTIDKPALIPSFNDSRVVGLDTETGVCFFRLDAGPPAKVSGQFFQLQKLSDGDAAH
ncbi:hypothetical protein KFE25_005960 [Diacronema lutheri]|uniref:Uncharacterized protein n=2 Tax=Diacronema lutheri TaxID=2081491 RepID=A0A8J6CGU7_DIALT|nr:hypothetical protein KFE25_005960 [Diacronema lutheri]